MFHDSFHHLVPWAVSVSPFSKITLDCFDGGRTLRFILMTIWVILLAIPAQAIERYQSRDHSCAQIKAIIRDQGAAIFRYNSTRKPGLTLYDRYVRNGTFCASHQTTEKVAIPAANGQSCSVSHCVTADDDCEFGDSSPRCLFR
jgi:hypothetical protein